MAVAKAYESHISLRMTIAARIVALRNQFIPCSSKEHFVAFFHFLYAATRRIVEFSCVRVDDIICAFEGESFWTGSGFCVAGGEVVRYCQES